MAFCSGGKSDEGREYRVANGSPLSLKPEMNEMAAKRKGFLSLIEPAVQCTQRKGVGGGEGMTEERWGKLIPKATFTISSHNPYLQMPRNTMRIKRSISTRTDSIAFSQSYVLICIEEILSYSLKFLVLVKKRWGWLKGFGR